jgi:hypothetical protein
MLLLQHKRPSQVVKPVHQTFTGIRMRNIVRALVIMPDLFCGWYTLGESKTAITAFPDTEFLTRKKMILSFQEFSDASGIAKRTGFISHNHYNSSKFKVQNSKL